MLQIMSSTFLLAFYLTMTSEVGGSKNYFTPVSGPRSPFAEVPIDCARREKDADEKYHSGNYLYGLNFLNCWLCRPTQLSSAASGRKFR